MREMTEKGIDKKMEDLVIAELFVKVIFFQQGKELDDVGILQQTYVVSYRTTQ